MSALRGRLVRTVPVFLLVSAVGAWATDPPPKAGAAPTTGVATRPAGAHTATPTAGNGSSGASFGATHQTSILGAAWNNDNSPIKQGHLQLRNVVTGHVDGTAVSNDAGQFAFQNVTPGNYLVELVGDAGHVRTVGDVFTIAPGETVATFVRVAAKAPWFTGFFSNAAQVVASSAASAGVTAIAPVVREVSPDSPKPTGGS